MTMKKTLFFFLTLLLFLVCTEVAAVNFSPSIYYYYPPNKAVHKFIRNCHLYAWGTTEKQSTKYQTTYNQLITKFPDQKNLLDCYYGYFNVCCPFPPESREKGFRLLTEAQPQLSDIPSKLQANIIALIAKCYLQGIGTEKNELKAFDLFQQATAIDSLYTENLAYLYLIGMGTEKNEKEAFSCFQRCYTGTFLHGLLSASAYEKMIAMVTLSRSDVDSKAKENYINGVRDLYVYKDYEAAKENLGKAADASLPTALYEMGNLYAQPQWKGYNKKERDIWYEKAAKAGYYPAVYMQGITEIQKVNNAVFVAQANKYYSDAYVYFKQLGDMGYGPAIIILKEYETNGWPIQSNLMGDIAKGVLSVNSMVNSITNDGLAAGLTSQMGNTGEQYGEINTVDDFLNALQLQNQQFEAKKRAKKIASSSSENESNNAQHVVDNNASTGVSSMTTDSYTPTDNTSTSTSYKTVKNGNKTNSSSANNNAPATNTRKCNKCGGSGKRPCYRCKGRSRETCGACNGKGYNLQFKDRKCTLCNGRGDIRCNACNGRGTEKCITCNGRGQVSK